MNRRSAGRHAAAGVLLGALIAALAGCTPAPIYTSKHRPPPPNVDRAPETPKPADRSRATTPPASGEEKFQVGQTLFGVASYYGPNFHGKRTANGETFDQNAMTCAHKSLPFGTMLRVTLIETRKTAVVRVNDRGPYVGDRILDLSREAARRIGLLELGTGEISATILSLGEE